MDKKRFGRAELLRMALVALLFISVGLLLVAAFRDSKPIKDAVEEATLNNAQQWIYVVGFPVLIAGLFAAFIWVLTGPRKDAPRKWWFYPCVAAGLAFCGFFLAYALLGMWPVGKKSAMMVDMHHQYGPLLMRLRDMLLHGDVSTYSFEIGMGTNFVTMAGYYLASPLNLLLMIFPAKYLTEAILVITLLKNMLCAFTFAAAAQYIYRRRDPLAAVTAVMYALMMYCLAYSWNIMWLDGLFMLPVVVMTFERLMRTGKYAAYVLALAYTLYANYYIAFMVCLFMIGYFLMFMLRHPRTLHQRRQGVLRFSVGSLLGAGIAAFLIFPVFIGLGQTSAAGGELPDLGAKFTLFDLLGRHLFGVTPTIRHRDLPNVYCGILTVVLVPVFATLKQIPLRRRMCWLSLLGLLALSLPVNQLNLFWHGMHEPNDLPYRFSFLYCFVLLFMAYEALRHADKLRPGVIGGAAALFAGYLMFEERFGDTSSYDFKTIYASLAFALVYALILLVIAKRKLWRKAGYMLLLTVVMVELTFNASWVIDSLNSREYYTRHSDYVDNVTTDAVRAAVRRAEAIADDAAMKDTVNGDFYRMETLPRRTTVDTALFGYRGITSFASSNLYTTTRFMGGMGYAVNGVNSYLYQQFNPVTDSLLGIRYIVLDKQLDDPGRLRYLDQVSAKRPHIDPDTGKPALDSETGKPVLDPETGEPLQDEQVRYIYENPQALSLAYRVNPAVKDWSSSFYDPVAGINTLYTAMTGLTGNVLEAQQLLVPEDYADSMKVNGVYGFTLSGGAGGATLEVDVQQAGQYVIYVDCRAADDIKAYVEGVNDDSPWPITRHEPYFIDAGYLTEGDRVGVKISGKITCSGKVFVARINPSIYDAAMTTLSDDGMRVTSFSDAHIKGTANVSKAGVMFTTIPFEKGWTVKVDGKKVATYAIDGAQRIDDKAGDNQVGALLAFDIPAGTHTLEFTFMPQGLMPGLMISIFCAAALVLLGMMTGKRREKMLDMLPALGRVFPLEGIDADMSMGGAEEAEAAEIPPEDSAPLETETPPEAETPLEDAAATEEETP